MYAKSTRPSAKREVQKERSARWECAREVGRFFIYNLVEWRQYYCCFYQILKFCCYDTKTIFSWMIIKNCFIRIIFFFYNLVERKQYFCWFHQIVGFCCYDTNTTFSWTSQTICSIQRNFFILFTIWFSGSNILVVSTKF